MDYNDEYSLPGGLDGLSRAIHKQQSTNVDKPEEQEPKVVRNLRKLQRRLKIQMLRLQKICHHLTRSWHMLMLFLKNIVLPKKLAT